MSTVTEPDFFQKYLIPVPEESYYICVVMTKAAQCAKSDHFLKAHGASALLATIAVAMSVFNTFSYLLQIPFKVVLNVLALTPHYIIPTLLNDSKNVVLSFVFVCLCSTFIVAALLTPKIFTNFAPYVPKTREQILEERLKKTEEEKKELKNEGTLKQTVIEHLVHINNKVNDENDVTV